MHRAALELADFPVVEIAQDVTRTVAHDQSHDLVVDAAVALVDYAADHVAKLRGGETLGVDRRKIDNAPRERHGVELVKASIEIALDESLAPLLPVFPRELLVHLTPDVGARVLERAAIPRVRRDLVIDVVMSQRDVIPLFDRQVLDAHFIRRAIGAEALDYAFDLIVDEQDVVFRRRITVENRKRSNSAWDRENRKL